MGKKRNFRKVLEKKRKKLVDTAETGEATAAMAGRRNTVDVVHAGGEK